MPRQPSDNGLRVVPDAGPTLLLTAPYFPPEGGGLEMYAYNIGCQLVAAHGWRVIVVTTGAHKRGTVVERMGPLLVHRLSHQLLLSNSRVGFGWPGELRRLIKRYRPDVINAHAPVPGLTDVLTAVAGSVPVVITYHVDSMLKGRRIPDAVIAPYERFVAPRVFERAHSLIAASQFVSNGILAPYADKTTVITPGVCLSTFKPGGLRDPDRILFAAGLSKGHAHKGLDVLIEAMPTIVARNPRAHLHVAGTGGCEADFRDLAERFGVGDRVQFLGRLDGDALVNAYRSAAVLTLPTRSDNYPMVLLEALACATPVVATCVGGIPSIVREGRNGYMVDPGDIDALADRLSRLVCSPTAARAMGEIGRHYALEYGWPSRAEATDAILRSAAGLPRRAAA
ncbi:MAG: glycosyltransferase family 4 protein [Acidimicrobiia bacterium]